MKEIMHVVVKQADDGNPGCGEGTGVIPQSSGSKQENFSPRPEAPC